MHRLRICVITATLGFCPSLVAESGALPAPAEEYCEWQVVNQGISEPLCGLDGNVERGRAIVSDSSRGNCVACHVLPLDGISVYGNIGPPLAGIASRYTEGQLRLRVTDTRQINPMSIMPGFYRDPSLIHRSGKRYAGRTFLTAQQVEDVVAYLKTLK